MKQSPRILIIGNGQLGSAFAELYGAAAAQITRADLDFSSATEGDYFRIFGKHQPNIVLNTAAHTLVDKAETERELAAQINSTAVGLLAKACKEYGAQLIHYSTDYVFDGRAEQPYTETDATNPINWYGATKLRGEQLIQASGCAYAIFRISWVYDAHHHNFLNTMLRLGAQRDVLSVVNDQIGAPCYAGDIAFATKEIIDHAKNNLPGASDGVYHMTHGGETSWYGFAQEIFTQARSYGQVLKIHTLETTTTAEYPTPAIRPLNSRLNCNKLRDTFNIVLPSWQDGLKRCMENKFTFTATAKDLA